MSGSEMLSTVTSYSSNPTVNPFGTASFSRVGFLAPIVGIITVLAAGIFLGQRWAASNHSVELTKKLKEKGDECNKAAEEEFAKQLQAKQTEWENTAAQELARKETEWKTQSKETVEGWGKEKEALEGKVSGLEKEKKTLEERLSGLNAEIVDKIETLSPEKSEVYKELQRNYDELNTYQTEILGQNTLLRNTAEENKKFFEERNLELSENENKLSDLEKEKKEFLEHSKKFSTELENKNEAQKKLTTELEEKTTQLSKLEKERSELNNKLLDLEKQLATSTSRQQEILGENAKYLEEKRALEAKAKQADTLREEIENLKKSKDSNENELSELKEELKRQSELNQDFEWISNIIHKFETKEITTFKNIATHGKSEKVKKLFNMIQEVEDLHWLVKTISSITPTTKLNQISLIGIGEKAKIVFNFCKTTIMQARKKVEEEKQENTQRTGSRRKNKPNTDPK